ncbi:MAG: competence/damage-inducible protein A [Erysipelotrichia bacterium]|nr:competence/damage-inducible protein A [Erysipelotrichia bacterium]
MKKPPVAEIISIGTELLLGEIVDTNASFIAAKLRDLGIFVYRKSTLGDNLERLANAITEALARADLIILSGGLGPTDDDTTREAIAAALNEKPAIDSRLLENLQKMFAARKRPMAEKNKKQAWLINSATALDNPVGTACGWMVKKDGKIIVALPGPPSELTRMWNEQVEPRLPVSGQVLFHKTIHTTGIGESDLAEKISQFTMLESPGIGTYARKSGVDVRVAAVATTRQMAIEIAQPVIANIEKILAPWIFGYDDETVVSAIKKILDLRRETISCMESVTGGQLASELTNCPGISTCFKGSITAYTNQIKITAGVAEELINRHGAVSAEVALAMAKASQKMFNTTWGLATTGVAGPDCLEGKTPGTAWVAVTGPGIEYTTFQDWPGDREMVKNRVCRTVLQSFFNTLKEKGQG